MTPCVTFRRNLAHIFTFGGSARPAALRHIWSHASDAVNRRPHVVWVQVTTGAFGRRERPLRPLQRGHQHAEQRAALLGQPVATPRRVEHAVGGEDRQPVGDRTRRGAGVYLEVGEPAPRPRTRPLTARIPSDCPSRSSFQGTGRRRRRVDRPPTAVWSKERRHRARPRTARAPLRNNVFLADRLSAHEPQVTSGAKSPRQARWCMAGSFLSVVGHPAALPHARWTPVPATSRRAWGEQVLSGAAVRLIGRRSSSPSRSGPQSRLSTECEIGSPAWIGRSGVTPQRLLHHQQGPLVGGDAHLRATALGPPCGHRYRPSARRRVGVRPARVGRARRPCGVCAAGDPFGQSGTRAVGRPGRRRTPGIPRCRRSCRW